MSCLFVINLIRKKPGSYYIKTYNLVYALHYLSYRLLMENYMVSNSGYFQHIFHGLALCLMVTFVGCAKYTPNALKTRMVNVTTKNNVTVGAHAMTEAECFATFSRRILKKGYCPVQLLITNDSDQSYILHAHNIELELESIASVAEKLNLNTAGRVISWGFPALFGLGFFIFPAIVEGLWSSEANKKMAADLAHRTISNDTTLCITPHRQINKVMFVAQEAMPSRFDITLEGKNNHTNVVFTLKPF